MQPGTEGRIRWAAFLGYAGVLALLTARHGLWLDELQHWCMARDSGSFHELFHITRNDGHPPLWHLLLFALTRFTKDPMAMQVLHGAIASGSAALVLWRAPWPWWQRVMFVFGYWSLFEFGVLARNYAPTVLFMLLAADEQHRRGITWRWALWLALMSASHVWGIAVAVAWCAAILLSGKRVKAWPYALSGLVIASLLFWRCIPADPLPSGPLLGGTPLPNALARVATITTQGLLPWPDLLQDRPWNHNILHERGRWLSLVLGTTLLSAIALGAPRGRWQRVFLLLAIGAGTVLPILGGFYTTRHYAPAFFAMAVTWWIADGASFSLMGRRLWTLLLTAQFIGGLLCVAMLFVSPPLSRINELPATLEARSLDDVPVVVEAYTASASVSGHLQRPVYLTTVQAMGSYCDWSAPDFVQDPPELVQRLEHLPWSRFLWCTHRPELADNVGNALGAEVVLVHDLSNAQIPTERITVFDVRRP